MRILIVGPGAMGILFSCLLRKVTPYVFVLDKDKKRARRLMRNGLRLKTGRRILKYNIPVFHSRKELKDKEIELVIFCVKAYSLLEAAKFVRSALKQEVYILTIQNGLLDFSPLKDLFGERRVIVGSTNLGATLREESLSEQLGQGDTFIGQSGSKPQVILKNIRRLFNKAGINTKIYPRMDQIIWSKLIVNAGINALTAISGLSNGGILEHEELGKIMQKLVMEAFKISKKMHIKLIYDDPIQYTETVIKRTQDNHSSMLQDVLHKKKTEIDFINGALLRLGFTLGVSTPYNEVVYLLVKALENSYEERI